MFYFLIEKSYLVLTSISTTTFRTADADVRAESVVASGHGNDFVAVWRDGTRENLHLNLPGLHNVLNAMAAVAIARELGVSLPSIRKALLEFQGIGRRCESHGWLTLPRGRCWLVRGSGPISSRRCSRQVP